MALQAILGLAEGVMLRDDILVPDPPPPVFRVALAPMVMPWDGEPKPWEALSTLVQVAEFALDRHAKGGERVHYTLASQPPTGWRWLAHGKELWVERATNARKI